MINKITGWIFGDIEHLDPTEAYALMAPHCHVSRYIHTIGMPWLHCH